jgi:hypothetical protein
MVTPDAPQRRGQKSGPAELDVIDGRVAPRSETPCFERMTASRHGGA